MLDAPGTSSQPEDSSDARESLIRLVSDAYRRLAVRSNPSEAPTWVVVSGDAAHAVAPGRQRPPSHLVIVDDQGHSTFVAIGLLSAARTGHELVGQLLANAASAVSYWSVARLRADIEQRCQTLAETAEGLTALFEDTAKAPVFWQALGENLLTGRFRLLFLVDEAPPELHAVIDLLKGRMGETELLVIALGAALQREQAYDESPDTPTVSQRERELGRLEPDSDRDPWDERSFLRRLAEQRGQDELAAASAILGWARDRGLSIRWQGSKDQGGFTPWMSRGEESLDLIGVRTNGDIDWHINDLMQTPMLTDTRVREEFLVHVRELPQERGANGEDAPMRLSNITDPIALEALIGTLDWIVDLVLSA